MLSFHRINSVSDLLFSNLFNLYALAFPTAERRTWAGLEYELNYEKRFFAQAILRDEKFVGLLNYWTFDRFFYIEHFAVTPTMRDQHIGTDALKMFKLETKLPIVFEVEMPVDSTSIRRILFYERLDFSVISHNYAQPPYEGDGFLIPMQLMCNDKHFAETHFAQIKETLYNKVYHYEEEKERENTTPKEELENP